MTTLLERILPLVQKPARYVGGEYHQIVKNLDEVDVRVAFCFPDTYEIYKGNGSVVDTVNKMLNNFASRYDSEITDGANELGRSMHDISLSPRLSSAKRSAMMNVRASRALFTTV